MQEARAEDSIALLVHDQSAHQRHPRPLLGGHRGLFGRWQVRTHHHQEEPLRGHHPHQRGSTGPDRIQPRQAGNGIQGITAQLDPDLHERVDPFGWNHQEDHIPRIKTYRPALLIENKKLIKIVGFIGNDLETSVLLFSVSFCIIDKNAFCIANIRFIFGLQFVT